ncbi:MAG: hypothetical protein HN348_06155 [Proteobacteria bacterium]|jgi:hypothetical protein|nr:hypothetical protein [Pseudomonadota bacterium]
MNLRHTIWVMLFLLLALVASANVPEARPRVVEPLPFDHSQHSRIFDKLGLHCTDCHPLGANNSSDEPLPDELAPSRAICHGCHEGQLRRAGEKCTDCHSHRGELLPQDHDVYWLELHSGRARALGADCFNCHEANQCVDCHERRGAMSRNPHGPGFGTIHGVEARFDPASCSRCHSPNTCTDCHSLGGPTL